MRTKSNVGNIIPSKSRRPLRRKANIMSSNCYSAKSPICIEKGMGSALVIFSSVITLGSLTVIGLWTQLEPVIGVVARLVS